MSTESIEHVRLGCLLHDIGKVVTEEEGTHVQLGVELLKKHGLPEPVVNAVAEHHEDKAFSSCSLPHCLGSRRHFWLPSRRSVMNPHDAYVKRMQVIEEIAKSFSRRFRSFFAFQAGRDVRVMVRPDEVSDSDLTILVAKIRERLEKEAQYASVQIKLLAVREVRATDITKAK